MHHLVGETREYSCGYAPRILRRSLKRKEGSELTDVLFVGGKDGSVTFLYRREGEVGFDRERVFNPSGPPVAAVRVIQDWGHEWLLLGRSDGSLEVVKWVKVTDHSAILPREILAPPRNVRRDPSDEESVRYGTWLDERHLVLSFRRAGTFLVELGQDTGHDLQALRDAVLDARRVDTGDGQLGGVRLAAQIGDSGAFLLIDQGGRLCRWEPPMGEPTPLFKGKWSAREPPPAFLNDVAYIGPPVDLFKDVRGLILTTETGIYGLDLRKRSWEGRSEQEWPRPLRLTLPRAGVFCMSVTYVELGQKAYLWVTDRHGDSRLFENHPLKEETDFRDWTLGFSNSGLVQTGSQVLIALGWTDKEEIWLAQACRDDHIRIHRYRDAPEDRGSDPRLLLVGDPLQSPDKVLLALKSFLIEHDSDRPLGAAPPYAVLAEVFEILAEDEEGRKRLFEFLSSPATWVAEAMLRESIALGDGKKAGRHLVAAVELWNLCLIGLVNRQPQPREEWYLGILHFLRDLTAAAEAPPLARYREYLLPAIDKAIRFARKWGLYGDVNPIRQNLVVPRKILEARRKQRSTWIDELTYSSLLFRRSYNVVLEDRSHRKQGRPAWALSTLEVGVGTLVAMSWRHEGLELGLLQGHTPDEARWHSLAQGPAVLARSPVGAPGHGQYSYSRAVLLLRPESAPTEEGIIYILAAIRRQAETSPSEEIGLWCGRLQGTGEAVHWEGSRTPMGLTEGDRPDLVGESVYHFLDLGSGLVAVGLRGVGGRSRVALIEVSSADGQGRVRLVDSCKLALDASDQLDSESLAQNRVWSLAKIERGSGSPSFLAGCENGEIWQVSVEQTGPGRKLALLPHYPIGRLAAPVTALSCRRLDGDRLRVFAGTRDGTVLCFQQVAGEKNRFTTLWATVEQEPICYLDCLPYQEGEESFSMVLAVARNGVCIAIDDRDKMETHVQQSDWKRPHRRPFPGIRRLRTQTRMPCFAASGIAPEAWSRPRGTWRFLATASDSGELRVLSLHYPRYTRERKRLFEQHLDRLWEILVLDMAGKPVHLRVIEAVYRASPLLALIPVHYLLDPDRETGRRNCKRIQRLMKMGESEPWWYPRALRPLWELRKAWDDRQGPDRMKRLEEQLRQLLHSARRRGDLDLFQEICILTLKRVNYWIFNLKEEPAALKELYFAVINAIEDSLQFWTGAPYHQQARARITVAKNLVDGDTFWRVLERVAAAGEGSPWFDILQRRIEGIRKLVFKGDFLVSLESLRAANHSLLRLCRRLSDTRRSVEQGTGPGFTAVPWQYLERYFRQLAYGAAQALGPKPRLSDALFHEYARTFALCLCACPEGAVRMVNRLTEARLILDPFSPDDLSARIENQFEVLERSFEVTPLPGLRELVMPILLRPDLEKLEPLVAFAEVAGEQTSGWATEPLAGIGRDLGELDEVYGILRRLLDLTRKLSTDARKLDLTRSGLEALLTPIPTLLATAPTSLLYKHSLAFWNDALESLTASGDGHLPRQSSGSKIRPEVVLFSNRLADWAEQMEGKLQGRYQRSEIFQPQSRLFGEALLRLKRAAQGFALSAAVQKNLVVGILGHHLLEDLDLHVLELREIARNLDPPGISGAEEPTGAAQRSRSTASRFASLLVRRANRALSLPKNLRSLARVLDTVKDESTACRLGEILQDFAPHDSGPATWSSTVGPEDGPMVGSGEREMLALVLHELHQNHLDHSGFGKSSAEGERPVAHWDPVKEHFVFAFPVQGTKREPRWRRLVEEVERMHLQEPCIPDSNTDVASTGAGLYLSSLAAAMVGWKLSLVLPKRKADSEKGWCTFHLEQPPREREVKAVRAPQAEAALAAPTAPGPSKQAGQARHIVVIDDKLAFALYAWREVGNVTGFRAAEMPEEEARNHFWPKDKPPAPIYIPNREVAVWWISAQGEQWKEELTRVLEAIPPPALCHFLVDVRGPADRGPARPGASPSTESEKAYLYEDVLKKLAAERPEDFPHRVWLISSYEFGTKFCQEHWFEIHTKTPETFRSLRWLEEDGSPCPGDSRQALHILVTGAGFELQDLPRELRLGLPPTSDLLEAWIKDSYGESPAEGKKQGSYPLPRGFENEPELCKAAAEPDLDRYWDTLLAAERRQPENAPPLAAAQCEHRLRESFRKQLLCYDWGYLDQTLAAASLDWGAWLSTNYTRFADRAIERVQPAYASTQAGSATRGENGPGTWRLIETSEEAERLERELLYRQHQGQQGERLLFKLHGDISHVLTMAIAGKDKEFPTSVQSFARLYLAARSYLQRLSRSSKTVVWHIVGHGLKDRLLVDLIREVFENGPQQRHHFLIVNPDEGHPERPSARPPSAQLFDQLAGIGRNVNIIRSSWTAERYLAVLGGQRLPQDEGALTELEEKIRVTLS